MFGDEGALKVCSSQRLRLTVIFIDYFAIDNVWFLQGNGGGGIYLAVARELLLVTDSAINTAPSQPRVPLSDGEEVMERRRSELEGLISTYEYVERDLWEP